MASGSMPPAHDRGGQTPGLAATRTLGEAPRIWGEGRRGDRPESGLTLLPRGEQFGAIKCDIEQCNIGKVLTLLS